MHLCFLLHDLHFGGGGERVAVNLSNELVNRGWEVTLLSLSKPHEFSIFKIDKRVKIDYFDLGSNGSITPGNKIKALFSLRNYFKRQNENVIVLGIGNFPTLLISMLPKLKNIKTVGCQHNSYAAIKNHWAVLRRLFFPRLNALISLTEQDLPRLLKINPNSFVIPNAVSFCPEETAQLKNKELLAIGRMDQPKGYDLLIKVFKKVNRSCPDWRLKIIGNGPEKESMIQQIQDLGLSGKVELLPPTSKIIDHYLGASVYVMTSRTEGLPMVLLEAQACGLPVVSFDIETGPREIITDGKDGYLVPPFDLDLMAEKLRSLCLDQHKRQQFGQHARINSQHFSNGSILPKWETLFEKLATN